MTNSEIWRVNGVDLAVATAGRGPLVVLAHGFPDLGLTWRLQAGTFVEAGYRVVVPDMRGYGGSDRPARQSAYAVQEIGLDLIGLLDHEGAERAHFVGHDWGAACVWRLGMDHPDRLVSLTGLSVPYAKPAPAPPMQIIRSRLGEDYYQVRFQEHAAPAALERDVRQTMAAAFGDRFEDLGRDGPSAPPAWLPQVLFDRYVAVFGESGFGGGLAYYRNIDENWRRDATGHDDLIESPSLFVTGSADPVVRLMRAESSSQAFSSLRTVVVDGAGHWVHQEAPVHVNRELLAHFARAEAGRTGP